MPELSLCGSCFEEDEECKDMFSGGGEMGVGAGREMRVRTGGGLGVVAGREMGVGTGREMRVRTGGGLGVGTGGEMGVRTGGGLGVGTGGEMGVGIGGRGGSRMGTGEKSDQFVICDATQRGPDLPLNQVQAPLTDQVLRSSPAVAPSTPHPKPAAEQRSEERKLLSASFNSSASRSTRRGDARTVRGLAVRGTPREEDGGGEVKGVGESRSEDKENSATRCIVERQEKQLQELQEKVRSYPWSIPATLDGLFPLFPPLPPLTFYPSLSSLSPSLPLPSLPLPPSPSPPPLLPLFPSHSSPFYAG